MDMTGGTIRSSLEAIARHTGADVDLLAPLVQVIRPDRSERRRGQAPRFTELLDLLEADEALRQGFSAYIGRLLHARSLGQALVDSDMPSGAFWNELKHRLWAKLLPEQPDPRSIEHVLVNVFFREWDGDWVGRLPMTECLRLLTVVGGRGLDELPMRSFCMQELLFAAKVLGLRIAGRAFDSAVLRMVPEQANFTNPFVALEDELDQYLDGLRAGTVSRAVHEPAHQRVLERMERCRSLIEQAYANSARFGMGFQLNQHLILMERMLDRLAVVLRLVVVQDGADGRRTTVDLARTVIRINAGRTRVMGFIDRSTQAVAREITQHAGRKGEQYITTTAGEYAVMFRKALGGGAVVAVACLMKAWLATLETSLFGQAFLYSLNYALAFIGIYLLHLTLATKQPAMTAATLAAALDEGRDRTDTERYGAVTELVERVWRSQFIAFLGNVLMAFPVALLLGMGWGYAFGPELLARKAPKMLHELDPFTSLAIPHAAIAGVFLFISGLIAGSVTNRSIHQRIPQRIEEHPVLKLMMGPRWRKRLSKVYEEHAGGILSNLWFGVFMGSTAIVGIVLGLPIDIRHITFAAGNLALGIVGSGPTLPAWTMVIAVLGIGFIGLMNFVVSFALSLSLAMRSRGIPLSEMVAIGLASWQRFKQHPRAYYLPPRQGRTDPPSS